MTFFFKLCYYLIFNTCDTFKLCMFFFCLIFGVCVSVYVFLCLGGWGDYGK